MEHLSPLDRLIAIEDIKILKARRDRAVDAKDWETYEALHAPDHVSVNDGHQEWHGAKVMIENLRQFLDGITTIHHSHTPEITFESPTRASGIWVFEDWAHWDGTDEWMHGFGHYIETYEKRDGKWLFTSRRTPRTRVEFSPGGRALLKKAAAQEAKRFGLPEGSKVIDNLPHKR